MSTVSTGRKFEERIAKLIGGWRRTKKHYGDSEPDLESDRIIGECKLRKSLALETWMQQVEEHGKPDKYCVVFSKVKGTKDNRTLCTVRILDFLELMNGTDFIHDNNES